MIKSATSKLKKEDGSRSPSPWPSTLWELRGNSQGWEEGKLGYMLHCLFAECRARKISRNCSGSDKELAVMSGGLARTGIEGMRGPGHLPPGGCLAAETCEFGTGTGGAWPAAFACLMLLFLIPKPQNGVLPPSVLSASLIFSFSTTPVL